MSGFGQIGGGAVTAASTSASGNGSFIQPFTGGAEQKVGSGLWWMRIVIGGLMAVLGIL